MQHSQHRARVVVVMDGDMQKQHHHHVRCHLSRGFEQLLRHISKIIGKPVNLQIKAFQRGINRVSGIDKLLYVLITNPSVHYYHDTFSRDGDVVYYTMEGAIGNQNPNSRANRYLPDPEAVYIIVSKVHERLYATFGIYRFAVEATDAVVPMQHADKNHNMREIFVVRYERVPGQEEFNVSLLVEPIQNSSSGGDGGDWTYGGYAASLCLFPDNSSSIE